MMSHHPNCSECEKEAECRCSCKSKLCNIHVIEHLKVKHSVSYLYTPISAQDILSIDQALQQLKNGFIHKVSVLSAEKLKKTSQLYSKIRDIMIEHAQKIKSYKLLKQQLTATLILAKHSGKLLKDSSDVFIKSLLKIKSKNKDQLPEEKLAKLINSYGFVYPHEMKEKSLSVSLQLSPIPPEEPARMAQSFVIPKDFTSSSFWGQIRSPATQSLPTKQIISDKCANCKVTICSNEPQCCHKCHSSTQNWNCTRCKIIVPVDQRLCLTCLNNFWQCQKCLFRNVNEDNCCQKCLENEPIRIVNACGICREPTHGGINCGVCTMKRNTNGCFWCNIFGYPPICDSCKIKSWLCKCGVTNSKATKTCMCGFVNKNIR